MDYVNLGKTGTQVSRICLGCMSYAAPEKGSHPWALNEEQSRPFIRKARELGINFFDTANVYSGGVSEEVLGRALRDFAKRDEIVIATKVYGKMRDGPNGSGLSRKAIMNEIDESLRRLGVDYVDLYQTHRWDYKLPSKKPWRRFTTSLRQAKPATLALRQCLPGSSVNLYTWLTCTGGRVS